MHARRYPGLVLVLVGVLLAGASPALSQESDPCLEQLRGDETRLQRYDALVGAFLEAQAAGSPEVQLAVLDQLEQVCDANLRLGVLRARARVDQGECAAAVIALRETAERARTVTSSAHATQAVEQVEAMESELEDTCRKRVTLQCPAGGRVRGQHGESACGDAVMLLRGTQSFEVEAPGYERIERTESVADATTVISFELVPSAVTVSALRVECAKPVDVTVNGAPVACGTAVSVAHGLVDIVARGDDGWIEERTVEVSAPVTVAFDAQEPHAGLSPLIGLTVLGGGLVVAVGGGGVLWLAESYRSDVRDARTSPDGDVVGLTQREAVDRIDTGETLDIVGGIAVGLGAALMAGGVTLWALAEDEPGVATAAGISPGSGGAILWWGARF